MSLRRREQVAGVNVVEAALEKNWAPGSTALHDTAGRKQKNKARFVVGLKVEVPHAAQHGGKVMRRTLVQLERLMLSQTSEAVVRAHANKTKNKQCSLC